MVFDVCDKEIGNHGWSVFTSTVPIVGCKRCMEIVVEIKHEFNLKEDEGE